jgi:hypothetical protein
MTAVPGPGASEIPAKHQEEPYSDRWWSWALEEYKSVKAEVQASLATQQQIAAFGVTVLGALATLSFTVELTFGTRAALGILGPLLSAAVVLTYVAEIERMVRAGLFIRSMEIRLASHYAGTAPISWETHLRQRGYRLPARYRAVAVIIVLLGLAPAVAVYTAAADVDGGDSAVIVVAALTALVQALYAAVRERAARKSRETVQEACPERTGTPARLAE